MCFYVQVPVSKLEGNTTIVGKESFEQFYGSPYLVITIKGLLKEDLYHVRSEWKWTKSLLEEKWSTNQRNFIWPTTRPGWWLSHFPAWTEVQELMHLRAICHVTWESERIFNWFRYNYFVNSHNLGTDLATTIPYHGLKSYLGIEIFLPFSKCSGIVTKILCV